VCGLICDVNYTARYPRNCEIRPITYMIPVLPFASIRPSNLRIPLLNFLLDGNSYEKILDFHLISFSGFYSGLRFYQMICTYFIHIADSSTADDVIMSSHIEYLIHLIILLCFTLYSKLVKNPALLTSFNTICNSALGQWFTFFWAKQITPDKILPVNDNTRYEHL